MINRALILNKLYCFDHTRARHCSDLKIYDGKARRRRCSNKIILHTKQREYVIFSPKGNLNTVLVLYTTPLWAFSRFQDDVNSPRDEVVT